jgi:hypothetical protein
LSNFRRQVSCTTAKRAMLKVREYIHTRTHTHMSVYATCYMLHATWYMVCARAYAYLTSASVCDTVGGRCCNAAFSSQKWYKNHVDTDEHWISTAHSSNKRTATEEVLHMSQKPTSDILIEMCEMESRSFCEQYGASSGAVPQYELIHTESNVLWDGTLSARKKLEAPITTPDHRVDEERDLR